MTKIYKAEIEDIHTIAELAEVIWTEHFTPIIGSEQVRYMLEHFQSYDAIMNAVTNDGYVYYTAYYDNAMCGYCGIRPDSNNNTNEIFLSKLYLHKDYRGKKIARAFFERILTDYPNCDRIWLTVNKHNEHTIAVYKKMGFEIIDEKCADIGNGFYMDDYIMSRRLLK